MALRTSTLDQLAVLVSLNANDEIVSRKDIVGWVESGDLESMPTWLTTNPDYRAGRGMYRLPIEELDFIESEGDEDTGDTENTGDAEDSSFTHAMPKDAGVSETRIESSVQFVPPRSKEYVSWGNSKDLRKVISARQFFPIFVSGLSGNGKTFSIEQECAKANREMFRVNITRLTDEDDLLGGFRLVDGDTVWFDGPVVEAMQRGAVLLLDEIDLGTDKIMCLQSVLEGKGVFIKKINRWVVPAPGFNVIATGNTKGQGDETDKFAGTNVMNEAFLDRFPMWLEQAYPKTAVESRIVKNHGKSFGISDEDIETITNPLINWASQTRKAYDDGASDSVITTRRICLIVQMFSIFNDGIEAAVKRALQRFDDETQKGFLDAFRACNVPPKSAEEKKRDAEKAKDKWGDIDTEAW